MGKPFTPLPSQLLLVLVTFFGAMTSLLVLYLAIDYKMLENFKCIFSHIK